MDLTVKNICKSFDEHNVLNNITFVFHSGKIYCTTAHSGSGKTTFFKILLNLEKADSGEILPASGLRFSAVFQENRLCEEFSAVENLLMLPENKKVPPSQIISELTKLLPSDCINHPVSTFSGGMKRRVAIIRAMMSNSDVILMDEPFTGLDTKTKQLAINYILKNLKQRILIVATHNQEEVALLNGTLLEF